MGKGLYLHESSELLLHIVEGVKFTLLLCYCLPLDCSQGAWSSSLLDTLSLSNEVSTHMFFLLCTF